MSSTRMTRGMLLRGSITPCEAGASTQSSKIYKNVILNEVKNLGRLGITSLFVDAKAPHPRFFVAPLLRMTLTENQVD